MNAYSDEMLKALSAAEDIIVGCVEHVRNYGEYDEYSRCQDTWDGYLVLRGLAKLGVKSARDALKAEATAIVNQFLKVCTQHEVETGQRPELVSLGCYEWSILFDPLNHGAVCDSAQGNVDKLHRDYRVCGVRVSSHGTKTLIAAGNVKSALPVHLL